MTKYVELYKNTTHKYKQIHKYKQKHKYKHKNKYKKHKYKHSQFTECEDGGGSEQ